MTRPLPLSTALLDALDGADEVLVTTRSRDRSGTVAMGFAVGPPGVVFLLTSALSLKARRWERDPWVRLTDPVSGESAEGVVVPLTVGDLDEIAEVLVDRFMTSGAATPEALRRLLDAGTHRLYRVEDAPADTGTGTAGG